jgi:hypothetical protein
MADKGFFASICDFFKGLFSSSASSKPATAGLTGVERYIRNKEQGSLTGVERYIRNQAANAKPLTGVESYIRNQASAKPMTSVERYIQNNA